MWALLRSPWVELFAYRRRQHLLFGTVFALFMLWLVRRDFDTGVSYHFIGMTAVTLLLDWPLAIVGGLAAQLGLLAMGRQDLAALGVNGLLFIALPVLVTKSAPSWSNGRNRRTLSSISSVQDSPQRRWRPCCACYWPWVCCGLTGFSRCRSGWRILSAICG